MSVIVPIQNKKAVREFVKHTYQIYEESKRRSDAVTTNADEMMRFATFLGYKGCIEDLMKDLITQYQVVPMLNDNGAADREGDCYMPMFRTISKIHDDIVMELIPPPAPIQVHVIPAQEGLNIYKH